MRAVVQRVLSASVEVDGRTVASIGGGLAVLLGLSPEDTEKDSEYMLNKILSLRIFNDSNGMMNLSLNDISGDLLIVPQFTLYGDARKGNRPTFSSAMKPDMAEIFFEEFVRKAEEQYEKVQSGIFAADMKLSLVNSGPVTIMLDSRKLF